MRNFLILPFFLCMSVLAFGQDLFRLTGKVTDHEGEDVLFGGAYLLDPQGVLEKYAVIENGQFRFSAQPKGKYRLRIEVPDHKFYEADLDLNSDQNPEISLELDPNQLDEVTLIGKRRTMSFNKGNIKINIADSYFETLPQVKDLLSKLPGIRMSPDGENISIIGKGTPLIYMENQRISFQDVQAIPVSNIQSIEILKNPSAKYEGEGRSVIIVHLKGKSGEGYHFLLSETASFKRRFNNYSSLSANYKKGRFSVHGNFAFNRLNHWESNQSDFRIPEEDITSNYHVITTSPRPQIVAGGSVYYKPDEKTAFSLTSNFRTQKEDFPINTRTYFQKNDDISNIITQTKNKDKRDYFTSGLSVTRKIDTTNTVFLGGQYTGFYQKLETDIANTKNDEGFTKGNFRKQDFKTERWTARLDYENKGSKKLLFEAGLNMGLARSRGFTAITERQTNEEEVRIYNYSESIFSGYSQVSGEMKKWAYATGIRLERNNVTGKFEHATENEVDRQNTNLLPFAKMSYALKENKELTLNYKRSVQRPGYFMASSITAYINPFVEFSSNINLKPTYTDALSLNYQFDKYNFEISYYHHKDPIYLTVRYQEQVKRLLMSMDNLDRENGFQIEISGPVTYKFLTSTNTLTLAYSDIKDQHAVSAYTSRPFLYYYSNNELDLIPGLNFAIDFWGQTSRYEGIYRRKPLFVVGASLSRTFLGNFQVSLNLKDIFKQMNFHEAYNIYGVKANSVFFADGREIAIGLKYSFGDEVKPEKNKKLIDEEASRVN